MKPDPDSIGSLVPDPVPGGLRLPSYHFYLFLCYEEVDVFFLEVLSQCCGSGIFIQHREY